MTTPASRPRQVTAACVAAGVAAALTLASIAGLLGDWPPTRLRFEIESAMRGDRFGAAGVSSDTVLAWMRVLLLAAAAGCVTSIVLAVHAARRNNGARIVLTIVLPVTAIASLTAGLAGLLLIAAAIYCAVLLWGGDARAWFLRPSEPAHTRAGPVPPPPRISAHHSSKERPDTMSTQPPEQGSTPGQPYPGPSYPGSGPQGPAYPGPSYPPPSPQSYGGYGQSYGGYGGGPVVPQRRPGTVTAAAVITIVMSGIAALGGLLVTLAYLVDRESFSDGIAENEAFSGAAFDADDVATVLFAMFLVVLVLALIAIFVAIKMMRGSGGMRITLVVLSAITIIVGIVTLPVGLLWSAAAITVIILCFAGGAGAWFDARAHKADSAGSQY